MAEARPSLYLIGPRGAGKSSAGTLAAKGLQVPFLDTDRLVEERAGQTIPELFAARGELAFRTLERHVLLALLEGEQAPAVVATGGGCVLDAEVRSRLRQSKRVLWLTADLPVLQARIAGTARPSLTGAAPTEELALILSQRHALYESCIHRRDACLDTGALGLREVADVIQRVWHASARDDLW